MEKIDSVARSKYIGYIGVMYPRIVNLPNNYSFFLFGPRGSGKSSILRREFPSDKVLWIDLLDPQEEALFQANPQELLARTQKLKPGSWVIIDEAQKVPALLDLVHKLIEEKKLLFALSGSSARKLKRGAANLLAGRAFVYHLYPFTSVELAAPQGPGFNLPSALSWGLLPKVLDFDNDMDRKRFLQAYAYSYLREEIQIEQIVRNLPSFRRFLEVAAQSSGTCVNFSKIARTIGTDHSVVRGYYEVLEDTLIGVHIPGFASSVRKQMTQAPKFYFFDTGVRRALENTLEIPLRSGTYEFGRTFEELVVMELYKLARYREKDESLCHLRTKSGLEIDLVMKRPGKSTWLIEIKSAEQVYAADAASLMAIQKDLEQSEAFLLSRDPHPKAFGTVKAYPWQEFIRRYFSDELDEPLT